MLVYSHVPRRRHVPRLHPVGPAPAVAPPPVGPLRVARLFAERRPSSIVAPSSTTGRERPWPRPRTKERVILLSFWFAPLTVVSLLTACYADHTFDGRTEQMSQRIPAHVGVLSRYCRRHWPDPISRRDG